jgi:hypothetical protein
MKEMVKVEVVLVRMKRLIQRRIGRRGHVNGSNSCYIGQVYVFYMIYRDVLVACCFLVGLFTTMETWIHTQFECHQTPQSCLSSTYAPVRPAKWCSEEAFGIIWESDCLGDPQGATAKWVRPHQPKTCVDHEEKDGRGWLEMVMMIPLIELSRACDAMRDEL